MKQILSLLLITTVCSFAFANDEGGGKEHHRRGPPKMNLTDEQQTCLDSKLGKRGESAERPSREVVEAAFTACGVEKPKGPPGDHRHRQAASEESDSNVDQ